MKRKITVRLLFMTLSVFSLLLLSCGGSEKGDKDAVGVSVTKNAAPEIWVTDSESQYTGIEAQSFKPEPPKGVQDPVEEQLNGNTDAKTEDE